MAKKQAKAKGSTGRNRNLSEDFIARYRSKPDVNETASGLLYRIRDDGDGADYDAHQQVKIHQRISLADGSVIDDTYKRGLAEQFGLAEAIPGLREGLKLMREGARYEFVIPADLAWGKKGNGRQIGPNSVMIMDVRLIEFFNID
jgi:FKBP-type peptidyl-prolyl cis-trans isomerase FkpA